MEKSELLTQDGDVHWSASKAWMTVMLDALNQALKQAGLPKPKRRKAAEEFLFELGQSFDNGWIRAKGKTHYPLLAFSPKFIDVGVALKQAAPIVLSDKTNELHALVADVIAEYFGEQKERLPKNSSGSVGDEIPDEPTAPDEVKALPQPCTTCQGTGKCRCLRDGAAPAEGCPRCGGSGQCRHCKGKGYPK